MTRTEQIRTERLNKFKDDLTLADQHLTAASFRTGEQRLDSLRAAHKELSEAMDTLKSPPQQASLRDEVDLAKESADHHLQLAANALASNHPGVADASLRQARVRLDEASRFTNSSVDPEDPKTVVRYIESRLKADDARWNKQELVDGESEQPVFIAPEWYFRRPGGPNGRPYTNAEFAMIKRDIAALSKKYPNWVIVPGTIYHGDAGTDGKILIRNDGLIARDGRVEVVPKKNQADGLVDNEVWDAPRGSNSRFTAGGHRYAVEICRDHQFGGAISESRNLVDIHVVTANSVKLNKSVIVARDGGLLVMCDGSGSGYVNIYRVKWKKNPKGAEVVKLREEVAEGYREMARIDQITVGIKADRELLYSERSALSRTDPNVAPQRKLLNEQIAALDAQENQLLAEAAVIQARREELAGYIDMQQLYTGNESPDQRFEVEKDRYR